MTSLKDRLTQPDILIAPGVYDALSGAFAQRAGFEAVYLSGASLAYTQFGRPDIGLISAGEVADQLARVAERISIPIIVDADTGFGNALNVQRTVKVFERMGASAIQLEDQTSPKRCGHLKGKSLISKGEMLGKVKAALDARLSDQTLVIARTDAVAVDGLAAALDRAHAYADAGADVIFVEAPRTRDQLQAVAADLSGTVPLLANMVEGGDTPPFSGSDLQAMGFSLVIFPGALVRAFSRMATDFFDTLKRDGTTANFMDRMVDFQGLNDILGTADVLAEGQKYEDQTKGTEQ